MPNPWISVDERLPDVGVDVLGVQCEDVAGHQEMCLIHRESDGGWLTDVLDDAYPTHWMPLPAPPPPAGDATNA